ncbi:Uncharacterised protein [uncultured archaeon]|nr:Uncharacterised protein [uncultured archaeon]
MENTIYLDGSILIAAQCIGDMNQDQRKIVSILEGVGPAYAYNPHIHRSLSINEDEIDIAVVRRNTVDS